jgi:hypothetical protein
LLSDSVPEAALKNITIKINKAPLQMFHNEAFIDVDLISSVPFMSTPKNTAIRMRYSDKEYLFYLYCGVAQQVPQRIPLPDATIPSNELTLDLVTVQ